MKKINFIVIGAFNFAIFGLAFSISYSFENDFQKVYFPPADYIHRDLFSLNLINLRYGVAWPSIRFHTWRDFDSLWCKIEPRENMWDFKRMDQDISLAQKHGVQIQFVLGTAPTWASARPWEAGCCLSDAPRGNRAEPRSIEDWHNYIKTVALRYKGRVKYYELWNEPNVKRFYSGTISNLVKLSRDAYITLKSIDPSIVVVSPSLSPCCKSFDYLDHFFSMGGGKWADVIGYHFYVAPNAPESMLELISKVRALMSRYGLENKPLWNTETGWNIINHDKNVVSEKWAGKPLTDDKAVSYLARTYILSWMMGAKRLYWYAWGHRCMGLTEFNGKTPKKVAMAYSVLQDWLIGFRMKKCTNKDNLWICEIQNKHNHTSFIIWNIKKKLMFNIPKKWHIKRMRDLFGEVRDIDTMSLIDVSPLPLLLEN